MIKRNDKGKVIPWHESAVRRAIANSKNKPYRALKNLKEARKYKDSYLIMEGDYGGQIYLSIPVKKIKCSTKNLYYLLEELDKRAWNDKEGTGIYFERMREGNVISGGMGGSIANKDLWIHKKFNNLKDKIKLFLEGKKVKI